MKFSIEIIDKEFKFDYECGEESHGGSMPVTVDSYLYFAGCLNEFAKHQNYRNERNLEKVKLRSVIESMEKDGYDFNKVKRERHDVQD